ncbi:MAG: acetyl-CoA hydrolase/transferase family protein [Planctomycetes bacterium]|nr:acetyl-CoA hydrolase/transferase family protein [Planctomycetota bacterium]
MIDTNKPAFAVSADEAVAPIRSGMTVFVHGGSATPTPLLEALARRTDLENVRLVHLHLAGPLPVLDPRHAGRFTSISLFTGAGARTPIAEGRAEYVPVFLSDIPSVFRSGKIRLDAALVQLSPADRHGFHTLGVSVDVARAAVDSAPLVIAEVNARMPRTRGNSAVHKSMIRVLCHTDRDLQDHPPELETEVTARIGEIVSGLVEDGSCIQVGIGAIPDAVLARLKGKRDLGVHTEMFSDRMVDLFESGAISNRNKSVHPGRLVTSFVVGSRRLFDFVDDNPVVEFHGADRTNDTALIRRNDRAVAVNSAIEIDLTGQVCADSMGHRIFSGIGGQMDFIRGAALSRGGKAIIALPATAAGGKVSRITHQLKEGAGVVTTRGHVHWVATEYGAVDIHAMTLRQRGEALISLAHPDFRGELRRQLAEIRHFTMS